MFGCNPDTMRKHYVALNETNVADQVMDRLIAAREQRGQAGNHGESGGKVGEPSDSLPENETQAENS
jgi:hypothetical protein